MTDLQSPLRNNGKESKNEPDETMVTVTEKVAITLAVHSEDCYEGRIDKERGQTILVALRSLLSYMNKMGRQQKVAFIARIACKELVIEAFCSYVSTHVSDMGTCTDPFCQELLYLTNEFLVAASDVNRIIQKRIVSIGIVRILLDALQKFSKLAIYEKKLEKRIFLILLLLGNCSEVAMEYHSFNNATFVLNILIPFIKSTTPLIRMSTLVVALHLGPLLSSTELTNLEFTSSEIKELLSGLKTALETPNCVSTIPLFGSVITSAKEILQELDLGMEVEKNAKLLEESSFTDIIPSILLCQVEDTLMSGLSLLWNFNIRSNLISNMACDSEVGHLLQSLLNEICSNSASPAAGKLASLILMSIPTDNEKDIHSLLEYAKGCYKHGHIAECQKVCKHIADSKDGGPALLLLAKCKFKIYRRNLLRFKLQENPEEKSFQKHVTIMKESKHAASLFVKALREGIIDEEGIKFLDMVLMDIVIELNELDKVNDSPCMLCLKLGSTLQKSHIIPRAVLKEISDSLLPRHGDKFYIRVSPAWTHPKDQYHYFSAKELRFFLLCAECEDRLNKGGELEFLNSFFLQLYEKSRGYQLLESKIVHYGEWLYHFCIGLLFRLMATTSGIPDAYAVNSQEVYNLFTVSRQYLLNKCKNLKSLPKVYLFLNPVNVPVEYKTSCVDAILNCPGFFDIQTHNLSDLDDFQPSMESLLTNRVHFALAHFGVFNILCKFSPEEDTELPPEWEINPEGGIYIVPAEEDRTKNIPSGVWSVFQEITKYWLQFSMESIFSMKDRPSKEITSDFSPHQDPKHPLLKAMGKEGMITKDVMENLDISVQINFLPSDIKIDLKSATVMLPANFKLLTHHTFIVSESEDLPVTLFIGMKSGKKTSKKLGSQAFIIFFRLIRPNSAFIVGYNILSISALLLENMNKINMKEQNELIQLAEKAAQSFIHQNLARSLHRKGYANLQLLIKCADHNLLPSTDMKCRSEIRCWYCKYRCEVCLQPATVGPDMTFPYESEVALRFCSENCASCLNVREPVISIEIPPPYTSSSFEKDSFHLFNVIAKIKLGRFEDVVMYCSFYHGFKTDKDPAGKFYVFLVCRSAFSQRMVACFVDSAASVLQDPLPDVDFHKGREDILNLNEAGTPVLFLVPTLNQIKVEIERKTNTSLNNVNLDVIMAKLKLLFQGQDENKCLIISRPLSPFSTSSTVNIADLIVKMVEFKEKLLYDHKINNELSAIIKVMMVNLRSSICDYEADNQELQRFIHSCFEFLMQILYGFHCCLDDTDNLLLLERLLLTIWSTFSTVIRHTDTLERHQNRSKELINNLLDHIAKEALLLANQNPKVHIIVAVLLKLLLNFCYEDNFRQFVDGNIVGDIVRPLLKSDIPEIQLLCKITIIFFAKSDLDSALLPDEIKKLTKCEISHLKVYVLKLCIPSELAISFLKKTILLPENTGLFKESNIMTSITRSLDIVYSTEELVDLLDMILIATQEVYETDTRNLKTEKITSDSSIVNLREECSSLSEKLQHLQSFLKAQNVQVGESSLKAEAVVEIYQVLDNCVSSLKWHPKKKLLQIPKHLVDNTVSELSLFLHLHLLDTGFCTNPKCEAVLHLIGKLLIRMCRHTTSQSFVVSSGLISTLLTTLDNTNLNEAATDDTVSKVVLCLTLLHYCSADAVEMYAFDNYHKVASILLDYLSTPYPTIYFLTKMNLMHIANLLDNRVLEVAALNKDILQKCVQGLFEALDNPVLFTRIFEYPMEATEIMKFLLEATILQENCCIMLDQGLLQCFPILLQNSETQIEAARLLWMLSQEKELHDRVIKEAPLLKGILESSIGEAGIEAKDVLKLVLICWKGYLKTGFEERLKYAVGCYAWSLIKECTIVCKSLVSVKDLPKHILAASSVILGKCQFKDYRRQQNLLSMRPYQDEEFVKLHDSCYSIARDSIKSMEPYTKDRCFDSEASQFFNIAMTDLAREATEKLAKMQRCLLCLQCPAALQHSHVVPKSVLTFFSDSMGETITKRCLKGINVPMKRRFKYRSPNEFAFFTFCKSCEGVFNEGGEKKFLTNFFLKIYNHKDVDCLKKEYILEYESWLYNFCISTLFRAVGVITGIPSYMESQKVFNFFIKCRKFLLGEIEADSTELPDLYLLFNPTSVPNEYKDRILNQVLICPASFFCDDIKLNDGLKSQPQVAQFLVAHIGIINILVPFEFPSIDLEQNCHKVSPIKGKCIIPKESDRILPKGLWQMFCQQSSDFRRETLKSLFHKKDKEPKAMPTAETEAKMQKLEAVKIVEATEKDQLIFADQCENESKAVLNLLPEQFIIIEEDAVVSMPPNYHLLLHYSTPDSDDTSVAFIGVLDKQRVPLRPFVIHYQSNLRNVFAAGFFLTPSGQVDDIICDTTLEGYPTVLLLVNRLKDSILSNLPVILQSRGFVNLQSLMYHYKHSTFGSPLDMKCRTSQRCWYCSKRCENCLSRASVMAKPITIDGIQVKFCGQSCQNLLMENNNPITVKALATNRSHSNTPKIPDGHTEVVVMSGEGMGLRFKVSVRKGYSSPKYPQGRHYCIFLCRTLFSQQCAEIFLNKDASPDCPLPHADCPVGHVQINNLKKEQVLHQFIQAGFRVVVRQKSLPDAMSQTMVTETIGFPMADNFMHSLNGNQRSTQPASSSVNATDSSIEGVYESLRQLVPGLPSCREVHGTKGYIKLVWLNLCLPESQLFDIFNVLLGILLQVSEGENASEILMNVFVLLLFKCIQFEILQEHCDPNLLEQLLQYSLSHPSLHRIFALMTLNLSSKCVLFKGKQLNSSSMDLVKEDIGNFQELLGYGDKVIAVPVIDFLADLVKIPENVKLLCVPGMLDALEQAIAIIDEDCIIEKVGILFECLLRESNNNDSNSKNQPSEGTEERVKSGNTPAPVIMTSTHSNSSALGAKTYEKLQKMLPGLPPPELVEGEITKEQVVHHWCTPLTVSLNTKIDLQKLINSVAELATYKPPDTNMTVVLIMLLKFIKQEGTFESYPVDLMELLATSLETYRQRHGTYQRIFTLMILCNSLKSCKNRKIEESLDLSVEDVNILCALLQQKQVILSGDIIDLLFETLHLPGNSSAKVMMDGGLLDVLQIVIDEMEEEEVLRKCVQLIEKLLQTN